MRKTFKSIMFIAAAAMAFTACNVEQVETPEKTIGTHKVTFVASQAETKTTMEINGGVASFAWEKADEGYFTVFENDEPSSLTVGSLNDGVMEISAVFENGTSPFTYTGFMAATVSNGNPAVSNEQIDLGAYDPESDILVAKPVTDKTTDDLNSGILFQFKRVVAINQMTLKGLTEGETVTEVTITSDKPIAGEYDFINGVWNASGTSISIDAEAVANTDGQAVVYFVSAPVEAAQLTITATTTEGKTYSKELAKTITFAEGGVKAFGVTVAEETVEPAYVKVTSTADLTDGKYLIVYETGLVALDGKLTSDVAANTVAVAISNGEIASTDDIDAAAVTFNAANGSFLGGGGKYIGHTGTSNTLNYSDDALGNDVSIDSEGNALIDAGSNYVLRFNKTTGQVRFRYYKGTQEAVQLYKYNGTIEVVSVTGVSLSQSVLELEVGDTKTLDATVTPENATNKSVTWTSNNESVATVAGGVVTGVAAGEATITVTTVDGEFTATCNVTVTAPSIYSTIADIMSKGPGSYSVENAVVMAKAGSNVILGDGTANIMLYHSGNSLEVGNVITIINKEVSERNGLYQFAISDYDVAVEKVTPEYGTPVEIMNDTDVVGWSGEPQYQYIHFKGSMQSDNRTIKCGEKGIYIASTTGFSGMNVEVYGYANGKMSSYGTITTTLVSIEEYEAVIPVETVTLNNTELTLNVGATSTLSATVVPVTATNKNVSWSSNNPAVATVLDGVVTAIAVGTATITVTTADGSKTATCAVTVTEKTGGDTDTVVLDKTISDYSAGTQYAANESHDLGDGFIIYTTECHFTTELRIYSSSTHDGYVVSDAFPGTISELRFNAGNNSDNLVVYGSNDGISWTLIKKVLVQKTYTDYTVSFGDSSYSRFKLDVEGTNQLRIKELGVTYVPAN